MQDFEKLSNFCKVTSNTKKDVILAAIDWQFENTEQCSMTYEKSTRRTVYVNFNADEVENLSRLAKFMNATTAQAGLISIRNFLGAAEEGMHEYFKVIPAEVSDNFITTVPREVYLVVSSNEKSANVLTHEALMHCKNLGTLHQTPKKSKGIQSPMVRVILKDDAHRQVILDLMTKFNETKGRIVARCLATYLLTEDTQEEDDLGIF